MPISRAASSYGGLQPIQILPGVVFPNLAGRCQMPVLLAGHVDDHGMVPFPEQCQERSSAVLPNGLVVSEQVSGNEPLPIQHQELGAQVHLQLPSSVRTRPPIRAFEYLPVLSTSSTTTSSSCFNSKPSHRKVNHPRVGKIQILLPGGWEGKIQILQPGGWMKCRMGSFCQLCN